MSNESPPFSASHRFDRTFHLVFALVAVVITAGGFLPRLSTIFSGERPWPPLIVHAHAVLFYGWLIFLVIQTWLIRAGSVTLHRRMGILGGGLALAMVVVGVWMSVEMAGVHLAKGKTWALGFLPVPLSDIGAFAVLIAFAIWKRQDSPAHKRLVVLATTVLLGAGIGRWNLYDVPPFPGLPFLDQLVDLYGVIWILLAAMVVYDLATRGRVHRVYLFGIPFMLAAQFAACLLMVWPGWGAFARQTFNLG